MKSWNKKPVDHIGYEQCLGRDIDKAVAMRARSRSSDCLLTDYVCKHPLYVRRLCNDSAAYERYLIGNSVAGRSPLRVNNQVLDRLLTDYAGKYPKHIRRLANDLPLYGDLLYGIAVKETGLLLHTWNAAVAEAGQYELSLSIFDFILSVYCDRVFQFLDHDKQAPLLLTNALLFQVTGQDASAVTEDDIRRGRSHKIRGIHKFLLLKQIKSRQSLNTQADARSGLLGLEIADILCGGPDRQVEHQVMARTALIRYDASTGIRLLLYNESPNSIKRTELEKEYEEALKTLGNVTNDIQNKPQNRKPGGLLRESISANKNIIDF